MSSLRRLLLWLYLANAVGYFVAFHYPVQPNHRSFTRLGIVAASLLWPVFPGAVLGSYDREHLR